MTGESPVSAKQLRSWLSDWVADALGLPDVDGARPLRELGLTSRHAVSLIGELEDLLDRTIPVTLAWEVPTIDAMVAHLMGDAAEPVSVTAPTIERPVDGGSGSAEPIAVIGVGCRLPGSVNGPDDFWDLLSAGRAGISDLPPGRWEQFVTASPTSDAVLESTVRRGGFLDDIAGFDADYFSISPAEAERMDPQQRLLLEVAVETLENAGVRPDALRGSDTGVFVGVSMNEYAQLTTAELAQVDAYTSTGGALSVIANRLSYLLDLRGPSLAMDSACSSSLVALHNACVSLRSGETSAAIVAGVNLLLGPAVTVAFDNASVLAPDGRCKTFSSDADGIVRGEGCGVVLLKRLSQAQADGDRVLAVVRGSGVNSDGRSNGMMAPNPHAQEALLRTVYSGTGIDPRQVDYVEAHGTGTLLGDPIEASALGAALGRGRAADRPLLIGSVKSNLGHLEAAAGIVGFIKVVLALSHDLLPASLNYAGPNPHIRFEAERLAVVDAARPWPRYSGTAIAGVSAFGFGGTNAHAVLEQAPAVERATEPPADTRADVLTLAAPTRRHLERAAGELAARFTEATEVPVRDVAYSLARHHGYGSERAAVTGRNQQDLLRGLGMLSEGLDAPNVVRGHARPDGAIPRTVWVFSGYGSQWAGMGRDLLAAEPVFTAAIEKLEPLVEAESGFSLRQLITAEDALVDVAASQLAIFAIQLGLAAVWRAAGLEPAAVVGHSMGEVAAAYVAGGLDLADAVRVMAVRSRLLAGVDAGGAGAMAVLALDAQIAERLASRYADVTIAVYASPQQCTVAGDREQVQALVADVEGLGHEAWLLKVAGAGHSAAVDPVLGELAASLAGVRPGDARIPFYSTVLDDPRGAAAFDADYWVANARRAVRFTQAIAAAAEDGLTTFVELSPHPIAQRSIAATLEAAGTTGVLVPGLRRDTDGAVSVATNLARLWVSGADGLLARRYERGLRVDLPGIHWQHRDFWFSAPVSPVVSGHPLLGRQVELPDDDRLRWHADLGTATVPWLRTLTDDVLPAAAYVEIMLAAGAEAFATEVFSADGAARIELAGLRIEHLLAPGASAQVVTSLEFADDGEAASVRISARVAPGAQSRPLATGTVRLLNGDEAVFEVPAADSAVIAAADRAHGNRHYRLDPATLQKVLQTLGDGQVRGIESLRIRGSIAGGGRAQADAEGGVTLLGTAGEVLLEARGVRIEPAAQLPVALEQLLFERRLVVADRPTTRRTEGSWLLIGPDAGPLAAELSAAGHLATTHPTVAELPATTGESGSPVTDVVLVVPEVTDGPAAVLDATRIARELGEVDAGARLWIVTHGAQPVDGAPGHPGAAALGALVRVLGLEAPELRATVVDLGPGESPAAAATELLTAADRESSLIEDDIVMRGNRRWVGRMSEATLTESALTGAALTNAALTGATPARTTAPGSYIITGGLGGLGLLVAHWLDQSARRPGALRIVLSSRRAVTAELQAELDTFAAEVVVVPGDIAEPGVAERLADAARAGGKHVRGVVHAAGLLEDQLVGSLDEDALRRVWAPKVTGVQRLHEATVEDSLDWFVGFSSAAAFVGSPGQAAYATANGYVDAFMHWRRAQGLPGSTINWGVWGQVGGASNAGNVLIDPIVATEGIDALAAIIASGRPATAVVRVDRRRSLVVLPGLAKVGYFADLFAGVTAESEADGGWIGADALRQADPAVATRLLSDRFRVRLAAIMGHRVDELDDTLPLTALGLDSLMGTRARNAVEQDLGVVLPSKLLLQGASIVDVEAYLIGELRITAESMNLAPVGAGPGYIPPRDPTERFLVGIWQDVLGRRPIGSTEVFADLGGDEPAALMVAARIAERLDWAPELADLLGHQTIETQADLIRERLEGNGGSPLRILNAPDSDRRPLFLFHPAGGPTSVYQPLVELLDADQPVYGFERLDDLPDVESKVKRYVDLIRELQPTGPYRLMGWSFGGILAGEAVDQLVSAGETVEFFARVDTIIPMADDSEPTSEFLAGRFQRFSEYISATYGKSFDIDHAALTGATEAEQLRIVFGGLRDSGIDLPPSVFTHQYTSYVDGRIAEVYELKPYDGHVVLYRALESDPIATTIDPRYRRLDDALGWEDYHPDLEIVKVPGNHISMIDPPNVEHIAAHLRSALADLDSVEP